VIAVALGQAQHAEGVANGYQAFLRAAEIGHLNYARRRFEEADLVLRPVFCRPIPALGFDARRECAAAGVRAVRAHRAALERLLAPPAEAPAEVPVEVPADTLADPRGALRRYWRQLNTWRDGALRPE